MSYQKVTNKKKCTTDGCVSLTINDKCNKCLHKNRQTVNTTKKCATTDCTNGVRTRTHCIKCTAAQKKKLMKCKTPGCSRNAHNDHCAECVNRQKREEAKQAKKNRKVTIDSLVEPAPIKLDKLIETQKEDVAMVDNIYRSSEDDERSGEGDDASFDMLMDEITAALKKYGVDNRTLTKCTLLLAELV